MNYLFHQRIKKKGFYKHSDEFLSLFSCYVDTKVLLKNFLNNLNIHNLSHSIVSRDIHFFFLYFSEKKTNKTSPKNIIRIPDFLNKMFKRHKDVT